MRRTGPLIGSAGEYTIENQFERSLILGEKSFRQTVFETATFATFNKLGSQWTKGSFGSFGARREMYELFGRKGVELSSGMANFVTGFYGNVFGNTFIDLKKSK